MSLSKKYQYVITLAESGSFSKAAKQLYIAQSSLSQYIQNLEHELGVTLFLRKQPLQLTDTGKKYLQTAYEIQYLEKQLNLQLNLLQPVKKGFLTIGITRYWGGLLLPRILPDFQQHYPGIELKIVEGRTFEVTKKLPELDVAFLTPPRNWKNNVLRKEKILEEEIKIAVQTELIPTNLQTSATLSNEVISQLPLILLHKKQKLRQIADDILKETNVNPKVFMETENITTAYKLASTGLAATFVPERINELTPPFKKVALYHLEQPIFWELAAIRSKEKHQPEYVDYLVMLAKKAFV